MLNIKSYIIFLVKCFGNSNIVFNFAVPKQHYLFTQKSNIMGKFIDETTEGKTLNDIQEEIRQMIKELTEEEKQIILKLIQGYDLH